MRTFSASVTGQIAAKEALPRRLFRLHLDSGVLCYTDHTSDLVFQGVTYHSRKISHSPINTFMGKQADTCGIMLDDVDGQISGYAEAEDFEGRKAEIWQVFLSRATATATNAEAKASTTIELSGIVGTFPASGRAFISGEEFAYTGYSGGGLTGCGSRLNDALAGAVVEGLFVIDGYPSTNDMIVQFSGKMDMPED